MYDIKCKVVEGSIKLFAIIEGKEKEIKVMRTRGNELELKFNNEISYEIINKNHLTIEKILTTLSSRGRQICMILYYVAANNEKGTNISKQECDELITQGVHQASRWESNYNEIGSPIAPETVYSNISRKMNTNMKKLREYIYEYIEGGYNVQDYLKEFLIANRSKSTDIQGIQDVFILINNEFTKG